MTVDGWSLPRSKPQPPNVGESKLSVTDVPLAFLKAYQNSQKHHARKEIKSKKKAKDSFLRNIKRPPSSPWRETLETLDFMAPQNLEESLSQLGFGVNGKVFVSCCSIEETNRLRSCCSVSVMETPLQGRGTGSCGFTQAELLDA